MYVKFYDNYNDFIKNDCYHTCVRIFYPDIPKTRNKNKEI